MADFKRKVLQLDGVTVHMKDPRRFIGKSDLTKRKIREVVMQTVEPVFTQEATEQMVKILNSTYANADLTYVLDNARQMNAKERTLSLSLLEEFENLFDVTLDG